MIGRKAAFWVAVGGVSILSHAALQLAADYVPSLGLGRLTSYINRSGSN